MFHDNVMTDSCVMALSGLSFESDVAHGAFETLVTGDPVSVTKKLPLLRDQTTLGDKRSPILNLNAFDADYDRAVTLSMEGSTDFITGVYLTSKKFIIRIIEAIKAFIKRVRDYFFGAKAKKAEQEKTAVAAVEAAASTLVFEIPKSEIENWAWLVMDDNFSKKTSFSLAEISGFIHQRLDQLEDTLFDFRANIKALSESLDAIRNALDSRAYSDAEKIGELTFKTTVQRTIRHFDKSPGLLYVETQGKTDKDKFEVLKRKPLRSDLEGFTVEVRAGDTSGVKNFYKIDGNLAYIADILEKTLNELEIVCGEGKTRPSKIDQLFMDINKNKRNTAKRKSLETLTFVKSIFRQQTLGTVESLNNVSFVVNKMVMSYGYLAKTLAAKSGVNMEDDGQAINTEDTAEAGARLLFKKLVDGKDQTDGALQAITENLRSVSLLLGKRDWTKPLVIGGKHYLEPTFNGSIENIIAATSLIKNLTGALSEYDQGSTSVARARFDSINQSLAGKHIFAAYWGSDGTRYETPPTQPNLTVDKPQLETLIEELTSLLITLTAAHESRSVAVGKVLSGAEQAIIARAKNEYFRQEDIDLMKSGFDFFDKAFCVNLLAGRLNDTITAIHSSIVVTA